MKSIEWHGRSWPVVDGIPYLRLGSEALADAALAASDEASALRLLLAENDRWWDGPAPDPADLDRLIAERDRLSLRQTMALLGWGRVADYFAHRWGDPTYLAGLALIDAHWTAPATAFELCCGIGHYARALDQAGVAVTGADLVFAKLWVAKHWVAPAARYLCFDADGPWPVEPRADLAFCHDAFYFLGEKAHVAARLRAVAPTLLLGHVHNRDWPNFSGGAAMSRSEVDALFPGARVYDDAALTAAAVDAAVPVPSDDVGEAFGIALGGPPARAAAGPLVLPAEGRALRRNPLCSGGAPAWPSPRYAAEYGARSTLTCDAPERAIMAPAWAAAARRRDLIDLPERW